MNVKEITQELIQKSDPGIAETSARFFKTGPGEYGEGDQFRGIRVPVLRKLARNFRKTPLGEVEKLLHSKYHEDRLLALFLLIIHYSAADENGKEKIYQLYLNSTRYINNWDLVDSSAGQIVGIFLRDKDRAKLYELADSPDLWERRISIMATFPYIKENDFQDTLKISEKLLNDMHDLIHKAVGWMLREIGNRDLKTEEEFLRKHYRTMPRVMLRYAIEKFPEDKRQFYLNRM
ncbi:MAG: DNA alkylation repair protein [Balneolaceae bacterium]